MKEETIIMTSKMTFLRGLLRLGGCARKSNVKTDIDDHDKVCDDKYDTIELASEHIGDKNGLLGYQEESISDQLSDINYIPGAWRSPSLGRRMVDRVRDSPRLARRAMNKMTSPLVMRRKKEDEIYIVTLHVVHSSGVVGRGDGRSDAW